MPDIAMCRGDGCALKSGCYRYIATPDKYRQTYFAAPPAEPDGSCRHLMPVRKPRVSTETI